MDAHKISPKISMLFERDMPYFFSLPQKSMKEYNSLSGES
jgi:hypothetical protein